MSQTSNDGPFKEPSSYHQLCRWLLISDFRVLSAEGWPPGDRDSALREETGQHYLSSWMSSTGGTLNPLRSLVEANGILR